MVNYTIQNVVDMAWKTNGLLNLMRVRGNSDAGILETAQARAFIASLNPVTASQGGLNEWYSVMERFAEEYEYDSGIRKYYSI